MKKMYILTRSHMDLSWRHPSIEHQPLNDNICRPYADIEEAQLQQAIEFAESNNYKTGVEQALAVQIYLTRNPDMKERLKKQIDRGNIEPLGGGLAIIDNNIVCGESLYRNQYYAIRYYKENFNYRPIFADCVDAFGINGQYPQILRQFGYLGITGNCRGMENNLPFWRGIDGTFIVLRNPEDIADMIYSTDMYTSYCPACKGEGCDECNKTGLNYHLHRPGQASYYSFEQKLKNLFTLDREEYYTIVCAEEGVYRDDFPLSISELCVVNGFLPIFVTYSEFLKHFDGNRLAAVASGNIPTDQIEPRTEGNPTASGCYSSRIILKQINRENEYALLSAEQLAALAFESDEYPRRKLERLWSKMAFSQFHDCITGTHSNRSFDELMRHQRDVRLGACQIAIKAIKLFEKKITVIEKEGLRAFVLFNTTAIDWTGTPLEAILEADDSSSYAVYDNNGNNLIVVSAVQVTGDTRNRVKIKFLGTVPANGYAVFYLGSGEPISFQCRTNFIENEYYRIDANGVYDNVIGTYVVDHDAGSLYINDDFGHPWGRRVGEHNGCLLTSQTDEIVCNKGMSQMKHSGYYASEAMHVNSMSWIQTITLYQGIRKVFYKTELDWDGQDCHVYADFPLMFNCGDEGTYEIPYGMIKRPAPPYLQEGLSFRDEWPCINWFAATNRDRYSIILYNRGLPGSRIRNNHMQISLLRSPSEEGWSCVDTSGALELGHHVFEYALSTCDGMLVNANPAAEGVQYNSSLYAVMAQPKCGIYPASHTFIHNSAKNVLLSVIKQDDGGDLVVRLYETNGISCNDEFSVSAVETDPMECNDRGTCQITYHPFEIKTLKVSRSDVLEIK